MNIIQIKGRDYELVASRLKRFRDAHPTWSLVSEILIDEGDRVVMRATIADETGRVVGVGTSEEDRTQGNVNRSGGALMNCETSSWGRALAACGFGSMTSIASAEEVMSAEARRDAAQEPKPAPQKPSPEPDSTATALARADAQFAKMDLSKAQQAQVDAALGQGDLQRLRSLYQSFMAGEVANAIPADWQAEAVRQGA